MTENYISTEAQSRSAQDILLFDPVSPAWARDLKRAVFSTPQARHHFLQAIEILNRQDRPGGDEDRLRRAVGHLVLGRLEEAQGLLKGLKADVPCARFFLGRCLMAANRNDEARKVLEEALSRTPQDHDARVAYLELVARREDPELLARELEMGRHIEGTPDWHYFQGLLNFLRRDLQEAVDSWEQCLDLDPQHLRALFCLARELDRHGEDERAIELYERAVAIPPVFVEALVNLGILYEDSGRYDEAIRCYDTLLAEEPDNWRVRLYLRDAEESLDMYIDEDQERKEDRRNQILRIPITDFELSVRSRNCLAKMELKTLGDLVKKTEQELLAYKNFGDTSLQEIKEILRQKGLKLGMGREELELTEPPEMGPDGALREPDDPRHKPVAELDLSVRARRVMEMLKIRSLGDICNKTEAELLACPNFGQTSLNEVKQKLDKFGLSLKG